MRKPLVVAIAIVIVISVLGFLLGKPGEVKAQSACPVGNGWVVEEIPTEIRSIWTRYPLESIKPIAQVCIEGKIMTEENPRTECFAVSGFGSKNLVILHFCHAPSSISYLYVATNTATPTFTLTPSNTATPTVTVTPTVTMTNTVTATPSNTATSIPTLTSTPTKQSLIQKMGEEKVLGVVVLSLAFLFAILVFLGIKTWKHR